MPVCGISFEERVKSVLSTLELDLEVQFAAGVNIRLIYHDEFKYRNIEALSEANKRAGGNPVVRVERPVRYYSQENLERTKNANPGVKFAEVRKLICAAWNAEPLEVKQRYKDKAVAERRRMVSQVANGGYLMPKKPIYVVRCKDRVAVSKANKLAGGDQAVRPALEPRDYYGQENRERIKNAHPEAKAAEVINLIRAAWNDEPSEVKQRYKDKAAAEKERERGELATGGYIKARGNKERTKPRRPDAIYFVDNRDRIKAAHPDAKSAEIEILLSAAWKSEPSAVKQRYKDKAAADRKRFAESAAGAGGSTDKRKKQKK